MPEVETLPNIYSAASRAETVVSCAADSAEADQTGCYPRTAGACLGIALRSAMWLVDHGADPAHIRSLLALGLRAGKVAP